MNECQSLNCKECPYIREEYDKQRNFLIENGYYLNDEVELYCEKLGMNISWYGACTEDLDDKEEIKQRKGNRRHNKRERTRRYRNKLKRLSKYFYGVYYRDKKYIRNQGFVDVKKPYYKRTYWGEHTKKYYKNYSNRVVRRYNKGLSNGNNYRKLFDYAWEID